MTRRQARRELGSTYRLQLFGLGFAGATRLLPSLHALGVDTLYVSPILAARPGSTHGYDVIDPTALEPAFGGQADFDALLRMLDEHGMRLLIDIVPNHMAATTDNPWFADVLRRGRRSRYASYFDIDWKAGDDKVVLCVHDGPPPDGQDDGKHYRLEDWRRAPFETNYRRFFDINDLIGVRQEDSAVFAATHRKIVEIAADPRVAGLRVDHVDGLADPGGYLVALRTAVPVDSAIEVEKIVEPEERLPAGWPVDGTTGYEFAAGVLGLFVDPTGAEEVRREQAMATGDRRSFADRAVGAKLAVIDELFPGAFDRVVELMSIALSGCERDELADALRWLTIHLGVYRIYRRGGEEVSEPDEEHLVAARAGFDGKAAEAMEALFGLLTGDLEAGSDARAAVVSWQQLTPAIMAKGVEDTALYEPGGLLALADVGSDPSRIATLLDFHTAMGLRQRVAPRALSALSTHDSKRAFDVRCRIAVLSEIAAEWADAVATLDKENTALEVEPAERRYIYQTLVGAWPISGQLDEEFISRIRGHLVKALREAKRRSSWLNPDLEHERAVEEFVEQLIADPASASVEMLETIVTDIEHAAAMNSLAAVVLRSCAPGVPDIYQNDESWFLALTDPDNRRPVDPALLATVDLAEGPVGLDMLHSWRDGRIKQALVRAGLELRRELPALFDAGDYLPIAAQGPHAEHVVSFERRHGGASVVCVVPRLARTLAGPGGFPTGEVWEDTEIALSSGSGYVNVLTGYRVAASPRVRLASVLATLPVAILRSAG